MNIPSSIPVSIGEMIAIHRDRLKMSQSTLAKAVGISRNYVSLIERGNENVSFSIMQKICDVLGLELMIKMAEVCPVCSSPAIRKNGYCALHDDMQSR